MRRTAVQVAEWAGWLTFVRKEVVRSYELRARRIAGAVRFRRERAAEEQRMRDRPTTPNEVVELMYVSLQEMGNALQQVVKLQADVEVSIGASRRFFDKSARESRLIKKLLAEQIRLEVAKTEMANLFDARRRKLIEAKTLQIQLEMHKLEAEMRKNVATLRKSFGRLESLKVFVQEIDTAK